MKKYLSIVLLVGVWSCEEESSIDRKYVGEWKVFYQGGDRYCTGDLVEDPKDDFHGYMCYYNPTPTLELGIQGDFILKYFCPSSVDSCTRHAFQGELFGAFPGDSRDSDGDTYIGGYNSDGLTYPGGSFNSDGEREVCNPNNDCDEVGGIWTSNDSVLTLTYDFSNESVSYNILEQGNELKMEIEYTWWWVNVVPHEDYVCRKIIMKKSS